MADLFDVQCTTCTWHEYAVAKAANLCPYCGAKVEQFNEAFYAALVPGATVRARWPIARQAGRLQELVAPKDAEGLIIEYDPAGIVVEFQGRRVLCWYAELRASPPAG